MAIRYLSGINVDSNTLFVDDSNNRVGIGTASPAYKLDVVASSNDGIRLASSNALIGGGATGGDAQLLYWNGSIVYYGRNSLGGSVSQHEFRTGGTTRLTIDSSGNVGIGTTSPADKLDVAGNISIGTSYKIYTGSASNSAGLDFGGSYFKASGYNGIIFYSSAAGVGSQSERMRITNAGNVGIGTTSPAAKLDVAGQIITSDSVLFTGNVSTPTGNSVFRPASNTLAFGTASTERMRIDASGNVGIGTTSPNHLLDVEAAGASARIYNLTSDGNTDFYLSTVGTIGSSRLLFGDTANNAIGKIIYRNTSDSMAFETNATEAMRINSSGDIGIGTASPAQAITIARGVSTNAYIELAGGGNTPSSAAILYGQDLNGDGYVWNRSSNSVIIGTASVERMRIDASGNVGIGTTSPSGKLHVKPDANSEFIFTGSSTSGYATTLHMDDTGLDIGHNSSGRSLNLKTNSLDRLTITGGGNVGIGTASPAYKLDVSGEIKGSSVYADTYRSARTDGDIYIQAATATDFVSIGTQVAQNLLRVQGDGNVGIGETNVDARLHITTASAGLVNQKFESAGSAAWRLGIPASQTYFAFDNSADALTSPKMVINSSGNVGIGTTTPSRALDIVASNGSQFRLAQTTADLTLKNAYINLRHYDNSEEDFTMILGSSDGTNNYLNIGGGTSIGNAATIQRFYTAANNTTTIGTERMRIDSSGNVGIGTTSPSEKLTIASGNISLSDSYAIRWGNNYLTGSDSADVLRLFTAGAERVRVDNVGNVGIGTTSPTAPLTFGKSVYGSESSENYFRIKFQDQGGTHNDVGIGQPASGALGFNITAGNYFSFNNGTSGEIARLNGTGLGIGTTSPATRLDLGAGNGAANGLSFGSSSTGVHRSSDGTTLDMGHWANVAVIIDTDNNDSSRHFSVMANSNDSTTATTLMRVLETGSVGIGTTSPTSSKLNVNSNGSSDSVIRIDGANARGASRYALQIVDSDTNGRGSVYVSTTSGPSAMFIGGNVGIGTTSPSASLHIEKSGDQASSVKGIVLSSGASGTNKYLPSITWSYGASGTPDFARLEAQRGGGTSGRMLFSVANSSGTMTEAMRIDDVGNVGIGTTTPADSLHVNGGGILNVGTTNTYAIHMNADNGSGPILTFGNSTDYDAYGAIKHASSQFQFLSINRDYNFLNNGSSVMLIDVSTGNVGIGATSPSEKLTINGDLWTGTIKQNTSTMLQRVNSSWTNNVTTDILYNAWTAGTSDYIVLRGAGNNATQAAFVAGKNGAYFGTHATTGAITDSSTAPLSTTWARIAATSFFNGNVGIGTTSPGTTLDIAGSSPVLRINSTGHAGIYIDRGSTSYDANLMFLTAGATKFRLWMDAADALGIRDESTATEMVTFKAGGNVGIGTTSPSYKLDVVASSNDGIRLASGNALIGGGATGGDAQLLYWNGSVAYYGRGSLGGSVSQHEFRTGGTTRLTIDSSGNVGIGTTSPGAKLDVEDSGADLIDLTRTSVGTYRLAISATDRFSVYDVGESSERLSIDSSGNVGIGTTSPDSKFHVEDTNPEVRITGTGGTSFPRLLWEYPVSATQASRWGLTCGASANIFYLYNYTQSKKIFQVDGTASHITLNHDAAGTTQIGTSTTQTAYQLYVATNVGQTGAIEAAGSVKITSGALGVNIAASATAGRIDASNDIVAYSTSDKRLKENIKPLENATEKVKKLTGVEFDWKEEHKAVHGYEGHDVGVIAQEVQEVLPEAIRTNDSGYLSVRYEKLIGLLIESNKELAARVQELEQKLKQ